MPERFSEEENHRPPSMAVKIKQRKFAFASQWCCVLFIFSFFRTKKKERKKKERQLRVLFINLDLSRSVQSHLHFAELQRVVVSSPFLPHEAVCAAAVVDAVQVSTQLNRLVPPRPAILDGKVRTRRVVVLVKSGELCTAVLTKTVPSVATVTRHRQPISICYVGNREV